ncbi:FMN-binding negative transcriptional regulator [Burkholderia sp. LMU1-1-1.1]
MHCPSMFREERLDVLHNLISAHPLATLITAGSNGLMANLIPFTLHVGGEHGILRAHLARGNKQLDALREGAEALVIFQGPECYVTPSWYPSKAENGKVVPTWNFAMVQARGNPQVFDDATWVRAQIDEMTNNHESQRERPWKVSDAPEDFIAAQLKAIVGIEIAISSIEGKWKVSQNRLPADRQGVIDGLRAEQVCPSMLAAMEVR